MIFGSDVKHLTRSVLLEEVGMPGMVHALVGFTAAVALIFLLWAGFARVEEVAIAPGEIVTSTRIQEVQPREGGVVSEVLVHEGQAVEQGQLLVRLDTFSAASELTTARISYSSLSAEKVRLLAILGQRDASASKAAGPQAILLQQARTDRQLKRSLYEERIQQRQADLLELRTRAKLLERKLDFLTQELAIQEDLYARGLSSLNVLLPLRKQQAELEAERSGLVAQRARVQRELGEARTERQRFETEERQDALLQLARVNDQLLQTDEVIRRCDERLRESEIRAPLSGVINHLRVQARGAVLARGEVLADIVPAERRLQADVKISPRDVGHVHAGFPVMLRLTSYDYSRFGGVPGKLVSVSAGPFLDRDGSPYHRGVVELTRAHVGRTEHFRVIPGMTLQADIKTGSKTILEYLLKPIYASAGQALRER